MSRLSVAMALSVAVEPAAAESTEDEAFRERFETCWGSRDHQCLYDILLENAETHGGLSACVAPQDTNGCKRDAFLLGLLAVATTFDESAEERREVAEHVMGLTPSATADNPRDGGGQFIVTLARYKACAELGDAGCVEDSAQRVRAFVDLAGLDIALSAAMDIDAGYTLEPGRAPEFEALVETIVVRE